MALPKLSIGVRRNLHSGYAFGQITPSQVTCTFDGSCTDHRQIMGLAVGANCPECEANAEAEARAQCAGSTVATFNFLGCT